MNQRAIGGMVLGDALPTAFESACLVQCTGVSGPQPHRGRNRPAPPASAPGPGAEIAEFDREDAALRLVALLSALRYAAGREVRIGGGRRRYCLQRVLVPESEREAAGRMLAGAWRQGRRVLLGTDPLPSSSSRDAQLLPLAEAAWRAAWLAGGRRRLVDALRVRVAHFELAAVLVRSARLMDVPAEIVTRPGCLLVTVSVAAVPRLEGAVAVS